jgi:hypothetical protein
VNASPLLFVICYLSFVITAPAVASYISLNTTLSSKVEGRTLKVSVISVNKGDESAFNVQAEVKAANREVMAEKLTELAVNGTYQAEINFLLPPGKPGSYPLILITHYTDANQYPFSALTAQTFVYQREAPTHLFGQIKSSPFSKEGDLRIILKNSGDKEIRAKTRLIYPNELSVDRAQIDFSIKPKSEQKGRFHLKNFSALSGSTYQLFAVSEFEDAGAHYTNIFPGTVKIMATEEIFGVKYSLLLVALAVLVIVFLGAQFFKWKKK